jgi:competence protein ComFC
MGFSISRWFRPEANHCDLCERPAFAIADRSPVPVRHPEARRVLQELCASCRHAIPWITSPVCRVCGRPEFCPDCPRRQHKHIRFSRSAVRYDTRMKDLLALYKYRGSERLEPVMAAMLAGAFERVCAELSGLRQAPPFQAITSVPLAQERLDDRGFNQAERMAVHLAEWYGVPYYPLLQRVRHTEKQSLKNRQSRLSDMKGNFIATPDASRLTHADPNCPLRMLLVDDIYTTGSTVNECAHALKEAFLHPNTPEPEIYGALWARS